MTDDSFGQDGKYAYSSDLQLLSGMVAPNSAPPELQGIVTPLSVDAWQDHLRSHPDDDFVQYLLSGIRGGFRIGFDYSQFSCGKGKSNMLSATKNSAVVEEYLKKECALGRVLGPFKKGSLEVHINRFGVIPKPHQPGKWRLIVDLSDPSGESVNDGVDPMLCSLSYKSVDDAVAVILRRGRGTLLAKLDLESAYRVVPVHPDDRPLLGMEWKDLIYVDAALPFGLRSAPKIFNALADGLMWIMKHRGITAVIHYLDDYLLFGDPGSHECAEALSLALRLCSGLGVPVAVHKLEGPATVLTFLGILLDTLKLEIRLPDDKLFRLKALFRSWRMKKCCTKRELLSLIGQLQHACRVVPPGRSFLRRMITLSTTAKDLHHHIRLNAGFRSDLQWWSAFLADWNGRQMLACISKVNPFATLLSDASGNWGCGAVCGEQWFQIRWPKSWTSVHITVKELLPIAVASAVWGRQWQGKTIRVRCDNAAVVAILRSGWSKNILAMHLMRCLFFFMARFHFFLMPEHIPGKLNVAADSLSRDKLALFFQQVPAASQTATVVPEELCQVLIHQQPDWTSLIWRDLFSFISRKV